MIVDEYIFILMRYQLGGTALGCPCSLKHGMARTGQQESELSTGQEVPNSHLKTQGLEELLIRKSWDHS